MAEIMNLYPPIVRTYTPAFTIDEQYGSPSCKIYFALSSFNGISDISNAQVVVRNQSTNLSALDPDTYPTEVMIVHVQIDENITTNEKYFIEILPSDMINGEFIIDQYYKVQIRFIDMSTEAALPDFHLEDHSYSPTDDWLTANLLHFSEWSTVTLIRGISIPRVKLKGYAEGQITDMPVNINNITITGELTFSDPDETETLKSYQVSFYEDLTNSENQTPIWTGEKIFTSSFANPNEIQEEINYEMQPNHTYTFFIDIVTQSAFSYRANFGVRVIAPAEPTEIVSTIAVETDEENARNKINIIREQQSSNYTGKIVVRRADSKTDFTTWNDLYFWTFDDVSTINEIWYDYTIESGIWYKYGVQEIDTNGNRTEMTTTVDSIMQIFDDAFLTIGNKQLKIKFNPQVSSFKNVISESKTETIGSKYPFIKRNAEINYAQFPVSGLIVTAMDETGLFTTKEELYKNAATLYDNYNEENDIPLWRDFVYERFFREKVMEFLHNSEVKLFRSPTEGNILVKLMDIQFQPNQSLGRMIWSFSSNAYELAECNLKNLEKYGILIKGAKPIVVESTFRPVQRIVIINNREEFPAEGEFNVLYVYKQQLYVWDSVNNRYIVISIPYWNEVPEPIINPGGAQFLGHQNLYTNGTNTLYQYNAYTHTMEPISEPTFNQEYYESGE